MTAIRRLVWIYTAVVGLLVVGGLGLFLATRTPAAPATIPAFGPGRVDTGACIADPAGCQVTMPVGEDGRPVIIADEVRADSDFTWELFCINEDLIAKFTPSRVWFDGDTSFNAALEPGSTSIALSDFPITAADLGLPATFGNCLVFNQSILITPSEIEEVNVHFSDHPERPLRLNTVVKYEFNGVTVNTDHGRYEVVETAFDTITVPLAEAIELAKSTQSVQNSAVSGGLIGAVVAAVIALGALTAAYPVSIARRNEALANDVIAARLHEFEDSIVPQMKVDRTGLIVTSSKAMKKLMHVDSTDGRYVHDFAAVPKGVDHHGLVSGFHDNPTPRSMSSYNSKVALRRDDGTEIPVDISLDQITEPDGTVLNHAVVTEAADRLHAAESQANAAQAATAQDLLSVSHHEVGREVIAMGFALDDLLDDPNDPEMQSEAQHAYALLEQSHEALYAVGSLARYERSPTQQDVTAEDIATIGVDGLKIETETISPFKNGDPTQLKLLVANAVRNSKRHSNATVVKIRTDIDTITISDNGGADPEVIRVAWETAIRPDGSHGQGLGIIQKVAASNGAEASIDADSAGTTITIRTLP